MTKHSYSKRNYWIFGESFSVEVFSKEYINWKGYSPKLHPQLVSEHFEFNKINLSKEGYSNDMIFDLFCQNIESIKDDDIIEFGWTTQERFRLGTNDGKWARMLPNWTLEDMRPDGDLNGISQNTIEELFVNRTNSIYKKELLNRIKFINYILPNNKIIHWSWSYPNSELKTYPTIKTETNGELNDYHYSEDAQLKLSKYIIDNINSDKNHFNHLIDFL